MRLDRVSAGDILWFHEVDTGENLEGFLFGPTQTYAGGEVLEESWYRQPVRPGWISEFGPSRIGDTMEVALWEFIDADDHFGPADPGFFEEAIDTVRLRLSRTADWWGRASRGTGYSRWHPTKRRRLSLDVRRNVEWWMSSHPDGGLHLRHRWGRPNGCRCSKSTRSAPSTCSTGPAYRERRVLDLRCRRHRESAARSIGPGSGSRATTAAAGARSDW